MNEEIKIEDSKDGPDLNQIKIPIASLRNLAIELMREGLTEIGLKDLLLRIQIAYRQSVD